MNALVLIAGTCIALGIAAGVAISWKAKLSVKFQMAVSGAILGIFVGILIYMSGWITAAFLVPRSPSIVELQKLSGKQYYVDTLRSDSGTVTAMYCSRGTTQVVAGNVTFDYGPTKLGYNRLEVWTDKPGWLQKFFEIPGFTYYTFHVQGIGKSLGWFQETMSAVVALDNEINESKPTELQGDQTPKELREKAEVVFKNKVLSLAIERDMLASKYNTYAARASQEEFLNQLYGSDRSRQLGDPPTAYHIRLLYWHLYSDVTTETP